MISADQKGSHAVSGTGETAIGEVTTGEADLGRTVLGDVAVGRVTPWGLTARVWVFHRRC